MKLNVCMTFSMSFVPFLLPPYQPCFFYLFRSYLFFPTFFISSFLLLNVPPTLSLHKKRNKQQSHVHNYSFHPSSYLPVLSFFIKMDFCVMIIIYIAIWVFAMKRVIVFFFSPFLPMSQRMHCARLS